MNLDLLSQTICKLYVYTNSFTDKNSNFKMNYFYHVTSCIKRVLYNKTMVDYLVIEYDVISNEQLVK